MKLNRGRERERDRGDYSASQLWSTSVHRGDGQWSAAALRRPCVQPNCPVASCDCGNGCVTEHDTAHFTGCPYVLIDTYSETEVSGRRQTDGHGGRIVHDTARQTNSSRNSVGTLEGHLTTRSLLVPAP